MRRTLQARHDRFALNRPFRIARGVKTAADVVTVTVSEGDVAGRGEGVPYPRYGESIEGALTAIEAARGLIEDGGAREDLLTVMPAGAARNALDCALWDLEARLSGQSVSDLAVRINLSARPERSRAALASKFGTRPSPSLGTSGEGVPDLDKYPVPIVSALTIGIDTPEAMAEAARAARGAPLLKVKVDADDPAARLMAVRAVAPDAALIVDPNESWDRELLATMQDVLVEARVDLLEQPVPAGDDGWLEHFISAVPICADEAVHVAADLDRVAARYGGVNVKLDKTGGLTEALVLAREARARGLKLMTGCMISSSLSIAPAFRIALMSDFVDLDGPLWLREDRPGGVRDEGGMLHPPAAGFWGDG